MKPYWDHFSVFFYIVLALAGLICIAFIKEKRTEINTSFSYRDYCSPVWIGIWTFFAAFRLVNARVGGKDAPDYIYFFEHCLDNKYTLWMKHVESDFLFKWITLAVRYLTDDYHVYFIIVYGFMIGCYVYFLKCFTHSKCNIAPYVLTFYLVLRGFNTIRNNLAIACIMLACVFLLRKEIKKAYVLAICSIFIHKAALLFALCIPFCHIFHGKNISKKWILAITLSSYIFGLLFQLYFVQFANKIDPTGSYAYYASRSLDISYFNNAWKIAFEQLVLACFAFIYEHKIKLLAIVNTDGMERRSIQLVWQLFIFDFMLIPVNYVLNIWRGYEFMYLPRIVLWAIILHLYTKDKAKDMRFVLTLIFIIVYLAWIVFRLYNTYEDSHLLPYIFSLT